MFKMDSYSNPRGQCHVCGKWRRLYMKDPVSGDVNYQTMFGGDSNCGEICRWCIAEKFPGATGEDPAICPKCLLEKMEEVKNLKYKLDNAPVPKENRTLRIGDREVKTDNNGGKVPHAR